jgi:peptidoglycan/LPS O-acetylase OafA/YrhL
MGAARSNSEEVRLARRRDIPLLRKHMPELDVLRGVAILMVVAFHGLYWSGATSTIHVVHLLMRATVVGWLGVNLFFVLSGFLITGILLDTRGKPSYFRQFYLRRVLRILPAYFATLIALILVRYIQLPQTIVALLFLANYMSALGIPGGYGPLWSLSVEEQFYLLWPALVAKVSVRALTAICVVLCLIEPLLRWLDASGRLPLGDVRGATYLIADNLALGALAAIFARSRFGTLRNGVRIGIALCAFGLAVFAAGYPFGILHRTNVVGNTLQTVPWNLFFTGILLFTLGLRSSFFSGIWTKPLRFLGYISYGLYLIHILVFSWYDGALSHVSNPSLLRLMQISSIRFLVCAGFAILIAWFSRQFYEERFLRIGKKLHSSEPAAASVLTTS